MSEDKEVEKLHFDLNLLKFALEKAIELCNLESKIFKSKIDVKVEELDRICQEKEDLINFIEWHIPLIVRYIKIHKDDLDDIDDLRNLGSRADAMTKGLQPPSLKQNLSVNDEKAIGNDKVSTITIIDTNKQQKKILEVVFENDSDVMPKNLSSLLKEMMGALEQNFNILSARKTFNDYLLNLMSDVMKTENNKNTNYNPKKKQARSGAHIIYNEDC